MHAELRKQVRTSLQLGVLVCVCLLSVAGIAQQSAVPAPAANNAVPNLINYSGVLRDSSGRAISAVSGVTFLLYQEEQGGSPLWLETQNVTPDRAGHYTVQLGAMSANGLPPNLFTTGEARWLAVQVAGEAEQPRVLLLAVPYAMKAADAATIGGLPPSAFVLAVPSNGAATVNTNNASNAVTFASVTAAATTSDVTTSGGTATAIPMFTTGTNIQNSILSQTGTSAINVKGKLYLPASGAATSSKGFTSEPQDFAASAYNSSTAAAIAETFQLQAEATGNDTSAPSGTLNFLFGAGTSAPTETGLKINNKGVISFASGQTFPGTGAGTVTSVDSGAGLTGGPITGTGTLSIATGGVTNTMLAHPSLTVTAGTDLTGGGAIALGGTATLNIDTTKIPQLASANTFKAAQTINGPSTAVALNVVSGGGLAAPQVKIQQSNSADSARLRFTNTGSTNYWDIAGITGSNPVLNFWNGSVGANLLEIFPTSIQANANLTVMNGPSGLDAGSFSSPANYGVYSSASADVNFNASVAGWETGASKENIGVWGYASSGLGIGTYSEAYSASQEGKGFPGDSTIGSWSDTSGGDGWQGIAALATADNGYGIVSFSDTSTFPTVYFQNDAAGGVVFLTGSGITTDNCSIDIHANLNCSGTVSAVAPVNNGSKQVALYGVSAAENWFEDAGGGQLSNGAAVVHLDDTFAQTVNTSVEYRVFLTPGGDCKGLYVSQKSATSFEVHELGGGTSNIAFDYRIMAKRRGFETVRLADRTKIAAMHGPTRHPAGADAQTTDQARLAHMKKVEEMRKAAGLRSANGKSLNRTR
jgi:hypothetical protein